jgi:hypothetical protein
MKCYFYGSNLLDDKLTRNQGIISFAIPDYGVVFRAQQYGNTYECEYAAVLALIKFIRLNYSHFRSAKPRFLTDSAMVVYQVKGRVNTTKQLKRFRDLVLFYMRKIGFELEWVPSNMNRAQMGASGAATNPKTPDFNYDIFDEKTRRNRGQGRNPRQSRNV